jgi:cytochrome P450 family 109
MSAKPTGPDLLDPALHGRPQDIRARAEEAPPVFWSEKWRSWCVTGYAEAFEVMRDPRFSLEYNMRKTEQTQDLAPEALELRRELYCGGLTHLNFAEGRSLLVMDPPEHTPYRRMLQPFFTEGNASKFIPIIEGIVTRLLDEWQGLEEVEVMNGLAYKVPVLLFGDILGIPESLRHKFIDYGAFTETRNTKSTLASVDDYRKAAAQGPAYMKKIDEVIVAKRGCPAKDIFSTLVTAEVAGQPLSDAQVRAMVYLLNTGSQTTTTALIGNAVYYFLRFGLWDRIRTNPELLPKAIEETLRFDPPAHYVGRQLAVDLELGGQKLAKGETVLVFFNAANRDPKEFKEPSEFNIERHPNRHLSFGFGGVHFCMGAPFARKEAIISLTQLMARYPRMTLAGEPQRAHAFGFSSLPVRLN